ncbi:MAG: DUF4175 family protein [Planctomycetota bacterium]
MTQERDPALLERPQLALRRIRQLRRRRRMMRIVTGALRWFVVALVAVWAMFLLDWVAVLPQVLRGAQGIGVLVVLAISFRAILLAVRVPASEDRLAALVEKASGDLEDSLITAVQLTDPENPRRHLYDPNLILETVKIAEQRMESLSPGSLLSWSRARAALGLLLLLTIPAVAGGWLRPDLARTFVDRDLLLGQQPWPRAYEMVIENPTKTDMVVAKGTSLVIDILKVRGGNARAYLDVIFPEQEGRREMREDVALDRKGSTGFRHVFQNLQRDIEFRVECGDFTGQWYSIRVRARPRIEGIDLQYEFPEYTGLLSGGEDSIVQSGHVKAPVGTKVSFSAKTSIPIVSAVRMEAHPSGDGETTTETKLTLEGTDTIRGVFPAEMDGRWWIALESSEGFRNENPITWRIAVIPDRAPEVSIVEPGQNIEVTPRALLDVGVKVRDDYGVISGELVFEPEVADEGEVRKISLEQLASLASDAREGEQTIQIDLSSWDLKAGQRVQYYSRAFDALQQEGVSRTWILSVLSEEELERITQDELTLLKERLEETFSVQREVRRELEDLEDSLQSGEPPKDLAPMARHARGGQDRVSTRVEDAAERLATISRRLLRNRMSDADELAWIQDLKKRLDTMTTERLDPARSALEQLATRTASNEANAADVEQAIDEVRKVERGLADVVSDLQEWGDLRTMIRKIEELLRSEKELEGRIEDKVRESLEQQTPGGGDR